jgi:hypothetical protein
MSLLLVANKESLLMDPIDWDSFKDKLFALTQNWPLEHFSIPKSTDALFRERSPLLHPPRRLSKHPTHLTQHPTHLTPSVSVLHFYTALVHKDQTKPKAIPMRDAELVAKMNRHPVFLSTLGILPNSFGALLKLHGHDNREGALLEISRSLFFSGFRIWSKRQSLASRYWRDIAPENRKRVLRKKSKKKKEEKQIESKCMNPFHYLQRHCNLSRQRLTRCPCSEIIVRSKPSRHN